MTQKKVSLRPIHSVYYDHKGTVIKTNPAKWASRAVLNAVHHMQHDHYAARTCEVYDSASGILHAVLRRGIMKMEIIYKRDPKEVV